MSSSSTGVSRPNIETITRTRFFFDVDFFHRADKAVERAVDDMDGIPDIIGKLDLVLFDAEPGDLFVGQRDRLGRRADKPGAAADVPDNVPGIVRQHHFDEDIAGENLAFYLTAFVILDFGYGFRRDADLLNQIRICRFSTIFSKLEATLFSYPE